MTSARALLSHPVCLALYLSLGSLLERNNFFSHPVTLLISFLSRILSCPLLSLLCSFIYCCHSSQSVSHFHLYYSFLVTPRLILHSWLPSLYFLWLRSRRPLFALTNAILSHSPIPKLVLLSFLLLFYDFLFYIPRHRSRFCDPLIPSLKSHSHPFSALWAGRAGSFWVARWHCVSYQHSTAVPLSLQRVIISFRVKGSICYKRTRASGTEGGEGGGDGM